LDDQLGKGHADKLISAGELADFVIAAKGRDTALELLGVNGVKKLSQDEFSGVHLSTMEAPKGKQTLNRSHRQNSREGLPCGTKLNPPTSMTGQLWRYRRFPNRQGVETFGASAGLETRDTADSEVCATICV
jgi:hypothetical protein